MSRAKRVDNNQADIVQALRQAGYSVQDLSRMGQGVPDLLVAGTCPCAHCGVLLRQNKLIEVKSERGALTPDERAWHIAWRGPIAIARSIDDALAAVGVRL